MDRGDLRAAPFSPGHRATGHTPGADHISAVLEVQQVKGQVRVTEEEGGSQERVMGFISLSLRLAGISLFLF